MSSRYDNLVKISRDRHQYAFSRFNWPEQISEDAWWTDPQQLSVAGTEYGKELDEAALKRLAKWECVNLFSININGEREILIRVAELLTLPVSRVFNDYLHHLIDEENQHMWWFQEFCKRYAGKHYSAKNTAIADHEVLSADARAVVTLARVLIFEEIGHYYNIALSRSREIHPFIRELNEAHRNDEARHITFGREAVGFLGPQVMSKSSPAEASFIRRHLRDFMQITLESLYNPAIYRDSALDMPGGALALRDSLLAHPARIDFNNRQLVGPVVALLKAAGLMEDGDE